MRYTIQMVAILLIALHAQAFQATPEFKHELSKVPLGRLASGREDALFALFLASDESVFFVGQSIDFCGGWAE